jgi:hypothetical protein
LNKVSPDVTLVAGFCVLRFNLQGSETESTVIRAGHDNENIRPHMRHQIREEICGIEQSDLSPS